MNTDSGGQREAVVPDDLRAALAASPAAEAAWANLTAIGRRDFIAWIGEAKQEETRRRRIERCCENLLKGKRRPCCFAVVPMDLYKALGEVPPAKAQWSRLSADEKRDFSDYVEASPEKTARKERVAEAIGLLAAGKRAR
ncbi:MAG: YdeI/OmpD-associated family protein [Fimbriimonadaceae bacterium]|nr:YdeI/OmpD-associated family protein [Fimbriimonadaceae bacterium]